MKKPPGITWLSGLLLTLTLAGIVLHWTTGYHYPASAELFFEMNTLNDWYELLVFIPLGILGLWLLYRENPWGIILLAGVAANGVYNYAMFATGRQNLWIFIWIAKLALSGTSVVLAWRLLPTVAKRTPLTKRLLIAGYLLLVVLLFGIQMGQRLLASASGRTVQMTMVESGVVDWGEPALRDPVIFMSLVLPFLISAILGIVLDTPWGFRSTVLVCAFIPGIVTAILFTGPLKEWLIAGSISRPMWEMSFMMTIFALPALASLKWIVRNRVD